MSSFWSTIIGAVVGGILAIVGGFLGAWWQTRRADDIARRIRREERREQALFAFSGKVTEVRNRLASINTMAETSPLTVQYNAASQALAELISPWLTSWAAVIYDRPIRDSIDALVSRTRALLPAGQAMPYPESEPAARAAHFARDLKELHGLTEKLWEEVYMATLRLGGLRDR